MHCTLLAPVKVPDALCLQLLPGEGQGVPEMPQEAHRTVPRDLPDAKKSEDMVYSICAKVPAAWPWQVSMEFVALGQAGGLYAASSTAQLQVCWCSRKALSAGRPQKGATCPMKSHIGSSLCITQQAAGCQTERLWSRQHCMAFVISAAHAGDAIQETAGQTITADHMHRLPV